MFIRTTVFKNLQIKTKEKDLNTTYISSKQLCTV